MGEKILGDYKILKEIGKGTLGTTLYAEHRFIKKPYVLKILPKELATDRQFLKRFEEEIATLALLDHPQIVKMHNVSFADGVYFVVTDCIVDSIGETTHLGQYMAGRKERLRENELFSLLYQIADALDYAHKMGGGIVHRSLKLSNLLIGKASPHLTVYLSDFGLANIIGAGHLVARSVKTMCDVLGTLPVDMNEKSEYEKYLPVPIEGQKISKLAQSFLQSYAFLAPEQKRKITEREEITVDIYAFGVLLFFLASGCFPEGVFTKISEIAPEYQSDWDSLLSACLHMDPNKRPKELLPLLEKITKETRAPGIADFVAAPRVSEIKMEPLSGEELKLILSKKMEEAFAASVPLEEEKVVSIEAKQVSFSSAPDTSASIIEEARESVLASPLVREPVVTEYYPEEKEKKKIEPLLTELAIIPSGRYLRGSGQGNRDEMPAHYIELSSFALDVHPVTNEQFVRFLEYMGGEKDHQYHDIIRLKDSRIKRAAGKLSTESGYSKHPVVGVTWYGAVAYAKWVGRRLPTEAEWEVAARGGEESLYPTGNAIEKSEANFFSSDTTPVKSYDPNRYGLFDMAGNVYEWCQDWYGYDYYETSSQEPINPLGPIQGVYRVLRGGCWKSLVDDLRCSHRHRNNPGAVNGTYGFRCAADIL